jgi:hypothetical protein
MKASMLGGTGYFASSAVQSGSSPKTREDLVAMRAIAIGQHPDEGVRVVQSLPDGHDLGAVLLISVPLVEAGCPTVRGHAPRHNSAP